MLDVQLLRLFHQRQHVPGERVRMAGALEAGDALTLIGEEDRAAAHMRLDRRQLTGVLGLVHGAS